MDEFDISVNKILKEIENIKLQVKELNRRKAILYYDIRVIRRNQINQIGDKYFPPR